MSDDLKPKTAAIKKLLGKAITNRPLSETEIRNWETKNKISLPLGYRYYLSEISNGGPGLDGRGIPALKFDKKMSKPFPLTGPWAHLDKDLIEELREQGLEDAEGTPIEWAYTLPKGAGITDGCLMIGQADDGCPYLLVLNGPFAGMVWTDGRGTGGSPVHPAGMSVDGHITPSKQELDASEFLSFLLRHIETNDVKKVSKAQAPPKKLISAPKVKASETSGDEINALVKAFTKGIPKSGDVFEKSIRNIAQDRNESANLSFGLAEELCFRLMGKPVLTPYFDSTPKEVPMLPAKCRLTDVMFTWKTLRPLIKDEHKHFFDEFVIKFFSYFALYEESLEVLIAAKGQALSAIDETAGKFLKYRRLTELEIFLSTCHQKLRPVMPSAKYLRGVSTVIAWTRQQHLVELGAKLEQFLD